MITWFFPSLFHCLHLGRYHGLLTAFPIISNAGGQGQCLGEWSYHWHGSLGFEAPFIFKTYFLVQANAILLDGTGSCKILVKFWNPLEVQDEFHHRFLCGPHGCSLQFHCDTSLPCLTWPVPFSLLPSLGLVAHSCLVVAAGIRSLTAYGLLTVAAPLKHWLGEGASEVAEVARGLSCSSARGTFLGQGLSLCLVAVELWHLSHWTTKEVALLILNKGERQGKSVIFHPCEIFLPSIQNARWHKVYIRVLSFWTACLFFMRVTGNFRDLSVQTSVVTAFSDPL